MTAAITIWQKHMIKLRAHSEEIFGMLIQPVLWVILFGLGMKNLIGKGIQGEGDYYIAFFVPGIIALTALGGAIGGGTVWLQERVRGIVNEYLVAPIARIGILIGNVLSITTKCLFQVIIIFIIGILMGAELKFNLIGMLGAIILISCYIFGFAGIALAVATKTNDSGAYHMLIFLFNLPILFMSNALYPLKSLPTWMEIGARLNPTSYVVDGIRQLVFVHGVDIAGGDTLNLWLCFLITGLFAIIGMGFATIVFKRSIK